jgi:hypothetical protein
VIKLLLLVPFLPFLPEEARGRFRARLALWLVRTAARLDVAVVVLTASAITATVDLMNEPPDKSWPQSTLN